MEKIMALLRANPDGMTTVDLASALGWSRAAVATTLKAMKRHALIQGNGVSREGAAIVAMRTRPLQMNIFAGRGWLARGRRAERRAVASWLD
jgi:DNA-binding IclR family transcriptional regulator